ncbi:hypothetical protein [Pseudomonas aeruginosa]|uniref:hypothetical protein n=1 Tax=Pseudomonas aeruginosa TaxID=287 RepID=UPI0029C08D2F|nr:hypothetical protein [Pseudomonas aeruginosa]
MPKSYRVLERSFINGQLKEKDSIVTLEIDSPGSNLELVPDNSSADERESIIADLKLYGIDVDKRTSLEKLRAKLAEVKGE